MLKATWDGIQRAGGSAMNSLVYVFNQLLTLLSWVVNGMTGGVRFLFESMLGSGASEQVVDSIRDKASEFSSSLDQIVESSKRMAGDVFESSARVAKDLSDLHIGPSGDDAYGKVISEGFSRLGASSFPNVSEFYTGRDPALEGIVQSGISQVTDDLSDIGIKSVGDALKTKTAAAAVGLGALGAAAAVAAASDSLGEPAAADPQQRTWGEFFGEVWDAADQEPMLGGRWVDLQ